MRFKFSSVTPFLLLTFISSSLILPCYAQQSPSIKTHHHHHHNQHHHHHHHNNNNNNNNNHHHQLINHDPILERKDFEIIIGGGDANPPTPPPEISPNCPPPPPPPQPCPPPPQPPAIGDRVRSASKVIQAFKAKVTSESCGYKKTWNGPNACNYKGFKCTYSHLHKQQVVYSVQFNGCGFAGDNLEICGFIDELPDISIFHANSNNFTGTIPSGLDPQTLPYLYELDLSNNKYMGDFPMNVLKATNLTFLDLRFNSFSGRVPPEIFTLDVIALFINNNKFEQELPENLGSTPAAFLTLANNKFTGQIPNSIGLAANLLYEVLFLNNELTGCLPYEIGLLKKARVFDVEGNYLTGPIPHSFACLRNMEYLIMARNKFYGPIPEFVCTLPKLTNLTMHDNYFTQVGPECMKLIRKRVLDVKGNCILGLPDQKSPEECDWFFNQPKYCQEEARWYQYVPCKGSASYLDGNVTVEAQSPRPALTYGALRP